MYHVTNNRNNAKGIMTKIREALESDTEELASIFLITRQQTFKWENPENLKIENYKKSIEGEKVFVAEIDKTIAGFISIWEPGGTFVAKIFRGGAENDLLTMAKQDFKKVKHFKPEASRKESSEFYLVALERKDIENLE